MLSQRGWTQAIEAEVADLVRRVLRAENINIGLDDDAKNALAAEARKSMLFYGNDPRLKIKYGDREISGDCFVRAGAPATPLDDYVLVAAVDQRRQQTGAFETPRLTAEELAVALGLPDDPQDTQRLTTVLYKLRDEAAITRDDDGRWRAAMRRLVQPGGVLRPASLRDIAIRVDELVADPAVMDRFRRMVREAHAQWKGRIPNPRWTRKAASVRIPTPAKCCSLAQ